MSNTLAIPEYQGRIRAGASLAEATTWHVGGPAQYLAEPSSVGDLLAITSFAQRNDIPLTILGHGSNVLISDEGIPGITVCLRRCLNGVSCAPSMRTIAAEAGCPLPKLSRTAAVHGVTGFEFLIGIPGTVGAGVVMNVGTGGSAGPSISGLIQSVTVLDPRDGRVFEQTPADLGMGHRHTNIQARGLWVLGAVFLAGGTGDPSQISEVGKRILEDRRAKQPPETYNAGSVFRQPEGGRPAGWYIDQIGMKGFRIGGAYVSERHANWIINDGTAVSRDIEQLVAVIIHRVKDAFGVELTPEVHFLPKPN